MKVVKVNGKLKVVSDATAAQGSAATLAILDAAAKDIKQSSH
jgi:hypothetical protein